MIRFHTIIPTAHQTQPIALPTLGLRAVRLAGRVPRPRQCPPLAPTATTAGLVQHSGLKRLCSILAHSRPIGGQIVTIDTISAPIRSTSHPSTHDNGSAKCPDSAHFRAIVCNVLHISTRVG